MLVPPPHSKLHFLQTATATAPNGKNDFAVAIREVSIFLEDVALHIPSYYEIQLVDRFNQDTKNISA